MQSGEKKKKKKKEKKNLAHFFLRCRRRCPRVDLWCRQLLLTLTPSWSGLIQFLSCGFCVFEEEEQSVFYSLRKKRKRQIRVF